MAPKSLSEVIDNQSTKHLENYGEYLNDLDLRSNQVDSFPPSYESYAKLSWYERLGYAFSIIESKTMWHDLENDECAVPTSIFSFSINELVSSDYNCSAEIGFCPVQTDLRPGVIRHPHLKIYIVSKSQSLPDKPSITTTYFADLEQIKVEQPTQDPDDRNYWYTVQSEPENKIHPKYIDEPLDPYFQEVVRLIDLGIETLYIREKVTNN